ncbi:MAG: outer membrane beta-barrel protein [Campylobacterota bacterium]|nr:outer membrane beta-barrel protein [Campylobacterota bacterium]
MKKLVFLVAVMAAIGTNAAAESYPAEGPDSYQASRDNLELIGSAYVGMGYSYMNTNMQTPIYGYNYDADVQGDAITLLAGYNVNQYFAVEGRFTTTVGDLSLDVSSGGFNEGIDFSGDMSNIALYLKPMYTSGQVTIYGLLGLGQVRLEDDSFASDDSESSFQWGLGLSFAGGEHLGIFMDYTRFYDNSGGFGNDSSEIDFVVDAFNFGLAYKF